MKLQSTALLSLTLSFGVNAYSYVGCYSDPGSLIGQGRFIYQSEGYCARVCSEQQKSVMATTGGIECFCGDEVPASSLLVPDSKCNTVCAGFPTEKCGGNNTWSVFAGDPQKSLSNSASVTTPRASISATSGSTRAHNTKSAAATSKVSIASVSSISASPSTPTSGAGRRYGLF